MGSSRALPAARVSLDSAAPIAAARPAARCFARRRAAIRRGIRPRAPEAGLPGGFPIPGRGISEILGAPSGIGWWRREFQSRDGGGGGWV